jgi:hypothetical protein
MGVPSYALVMPAGASAPATAEAPTVCSGDPVDNLSNTQ